MAVPTVFFIALALAMDAFAVAVGVGVALGKPTRIQGFRLAVFFGFFQWGMSIVGWLSGRWILFTIQAIDHWIAFFLLLFVGGKMILESFQKAGQRIGKKSDPTKGATLILLSAATSIDALAVGLSFALLDVSIHFPAAVIGTVAFCLSLLGTALGPRLGGPFGRRAELIGGGVLIVIGVKILVEHLG